MSTLSEQDLHDILDGACVLGAGGGGPYRLGQQFLADLAGKAVELVAVADVPITATAAISAGVGSPNAASSGFPADAPVRAWDALAGSLSGPLTHVLAAELGAANSLLPMLVAAGHGIPIVDGAGASRAVPSLTMCTYATNTVPIGTVFLANATEKVSFSAGDPATSDTVMRGVISSGAFTEDAGVAVWAMDGAAVRSATIAGTTTKCRLLGARLRDARAKREDPVEVVAKELKGSVLIRGKITASGETTSGGFDTGFVEVSPTKGPGLRIVNQNENLVAWREDRAEPVALAPDLICYLTADGRPFSNADLDIPGGGEIAVIAAPADGAMRSPEMVAAFLPALRSAGYGGPYRPLECPLEG